jgi:hypothetical protein
VAAILQVSQPGLCSQNQFLVRSEFSWDAQKSSRLYSELSTIVEKRILGNNKFIKNFTNCILLSFALSISY